MEKIAERLVAALLIGLMAVVGATAIQMVDDTTKVGGPNKAAEQVLERILAP